MSIKLKLIVLFVLIKVIPIIIIAYLAIQGAMQLNDYFTQNTKETTANTKNVLKLTAQSAIDDSVRALDKKSQENLEKLSAMLASSVADFLYERDKDVLFLSTISINQTNLENFFLAKNRKVLIHDKYTYNEKTKVWEDKNNLIENEKEEAFANNKDNSREFNIIQKVNYKTKSLPIYKEISYFDLEGQEIHKVSALNSKKLDISNKNNTYIKAEDYYEKINTLDKGEIYVSDVIGAYVKSNVIGNFTKEKAKKMGVEFKPENHAYAGLENPNGKRFEGIIRFITPIFKNGIKRGYLSFALDHRHIMDFTDTFNPVNSEIKQSIANAGLGNYSFMWDYEGRNISHPRDFFIVGFDPETGKRVPGWITKKISEEFKKSKTKDLNTFLANYPKFSDQSLKEKPNIAQLKKEGEIGLDCRYLNFAPQCEGWMQVTENGGYGSFVIFFSKVWKLSTAASIPYYTGQYKNSKRGFGFVTIGANIEEFHSAANKTKENLKDILEKQTILMEEKIVKNSTSIQAYVKSLINELTVFSFIMIILVIFIAVWMSNYISNKINNLIFGTKEFAKNNLDYRIKVTSKDEIGKLEDSFNNMAISIQKERDELKQKDRLMFQQSKMAAMGEMIENIAHQWRQPLSMISSMTTGLIVQKELNLINDKDLKDDLHSIKSNTEYLSKTIDDFRSFFKANKKEIEYNINKTLERTLLILRPKLREETIEVKLDTQDITLMGLENELIQVIMNILNNAKDALHDKKYKKLIFIKVSNINNHAVLEIKDNAGGIPLDIIDKIFEPYFTTKHQFEGTGIGLFMSEEIISKHMKGKLEVSNVRYSFEEKEFTGAQFIIKLPITTK